MALETLEFKDEDESVGPFRRRLFFVFSLVALCFLILAADSLGYRSLTEISMSSVQSKIAR